MKASFLRALNIRIAEEETGCIPLIVCVGMSMIGIDDVGLEEVAAVVAIEVNSRVRWDAIH